MCHVEGTAAAGCISSPSRPFAMASRSLLAKLSLLSTPAARLPTLLGLELLTGPRSIRGACAVHKFTRKYLPLLAYNNSDLRISRKEVSGEGAHPSVIATFADGSTRVLVGKEFTDGAIFRELSGVDVAFPVKAKSKGRRKAVPASSAPTEDAPSAVANPA